MNIRFESKVKDKLLFRDLDKTDGKKLGDFFELLSADTRSKYGPHPLTKDKANAICNNLPEEKTKRFVIVKSSEIIGYFIIDFNPFEEESKRYYGYGVELNSKIDPVFAPCIADGYQNQGIAAKAMEFILQYARNESIRSIVLMGGTQELNTLARSYYRKLGFKEYGRFYTADNGLNNIDMKLDL